MRHRLLLDDIDAAGVAFAPRLAALAHQAVERALAGGPLDFARLLAEGRWALPIVHLACDFHAPLRHGDELDLSVGLVALGERSARLRTELRRDGALVATAEQVHACLDRAIGAASPWPEALRAAWRALPAAQKS